MARILVVEDEDKLRRALQRGLQEHGHAVIAVADAEEGRAQAAVGAFDCLILDRMLPGGDGLEVLGALRAAGLQTPALILTARAEIEERVRGLDAGADDYLAKPFAWAELLARVRACLRRGSEQSTIVLRVGEIAIDRVARRVTRAGVAIDLTAREFELLEYLARSRGEVVSRDRLARDVWRDPEAGLTNVIDVYINYLRKKLARAGEPAPIRTVRGAGYCLDE